MKVEGGWCGLGVIIVTKFSMKYFHFICVITGSSCVKDHCFGKTELKLPLPFIGGGMKFPRAPRIVGYILFLFFFVFFCIIYIIPHMYR